MCTLHKTQSKHLFFKGCKCLSQAEQKRCYWSRILNIILGFKLEWCYFHSAKLPSESGKDGTNFVSAALMWDLAARSGKPGSFSVIDLVCGLKEGISSLAARLWALLAGLWETPGCPAWRWSCLDYPSQLEGFSRRWDDQPQDCLSQMSKLLIQQLWSPQPVTFPGHSLQNLSLRCVFVHSFTQWSLVFWFLGGEGLLKKDRWCNLHGKEV